MSRRRRLQRWLAAVSFILIAVTAVLVRYFLFSESILYGEAAARAASLLVAGVIVAAGYVPLRMFRIRGSESDVPQETVVATLTAILGLAVVGFSVSQLLAPNTPVAASAPACGGAPVYGARFFAKTPSNGVNARKGAGTEYPQVNRYGGDCTLGFDGYCIGTAITDPILNTPDQRWLIVHHRAELVASGVVLSQSAESALGSVPSPECKKFGGLPQPTEIQKFSYNVTSGQLNSSAPGAVAVGYGLATTSQQGRSYQAGQFVIMPGPPGNLPAETIASKMKAAHDVWLGAAICLADAVPITASLQVKLLTFHGTHITKQQAVTTIPSSVRPLLADIACNRTGL